MMKRFLILSLTMFLAITSTWGDNYLTPTSRTATNELFRLERQGENSNYFISGGSLSTSSIQSKPNNAPDNCWYLAKNNSTSSYICVSLPSGVSLQVGDEIKIYGYHPLSYNATRGFNIHVDTPTADNSKVLVNMPSSGYTAYSLANASYTITSEDGISGSSVLYIRGDGSNAVGIQKLTITRTGSDDKVPNAVSDKTWDLYSRAQTNNKNGYYYDASAVDDDLFYSKNMRENKQSSTPLRWGMQMTSAVSNEFDFTTAEYALGFMLAAGTHYVTIYYAGNAPEVKSRVGATNTTWTGTAGTADVNGCIPLHYTFTRADYVTPVFISKKGSNNPTITKIIVSSTELVMPPTISQEGNTVTIVAGSSNAGSAITTYYTTDGTEPSSSNGTEYTEPITLTANVTVKAVSISSTSVSSEVSLLVCAYTPASYELTSSVPAGNGSITLKKGDDEVTTAQIDDAITVVATPNEGYYLSALTWKQTGAEGDGTDILSTKTFTMPTYPVTVTATFTAKSAPEVTAAPTAITPTYTGSAQDLVTAGEVTGGTIVFATSENGVYNTTIPQGTDAGNYTVWYKVEGDANHSDVSATQIADVKINPKAVTISGITASNKTYNGNTAATLVYTNLSVSGKCGEDEVSATAIGSFADKTVGTEKTVTLSDLTLTGAKAGNYVLAAESQQTSTSANITALEATLAWENTTLTYDGTEKAPTATVSNKVEGDDVNVTVTGGQIEVGTDYTATASGLTGADAGNYVLPAEKTTTYSISASAATVTVAPAAIENLTYTGEAQALISAGTASGGTMQYSLTSSSGFSAEIPTATNAGNYTVYYMVVGDANHGNTDEASVAVTVAKYNITNATAANAIEDQTYTGSALTPDAPSIKMGETVIDAENYNVAYTNNTEVGTATVTYTAKDESTNFSGTKTLNFNIVAAASEEYVSAATTWTFNSQTAGEITSRKVIDKLYARVVSGRSYTFEALATAQTLTFSDGASTQVSVEKVATGTGQISYNTKIATANDSPSGSSNDMTPSFAFNTTVKGTVYAYLQEIGESHNSSYRQRIYFGNGTSTISSVYSQGGAGALGVEEIKYTSSSAGTFVVGSTTALSKIYAIRFVPTRSITISDAIEHGTVTADKSEGGMGDVVTLTVTPSTGYELGSVSVNGTAIEGTTFAMPDANVTVTATFNAINYAVTVTQHTGGEVKVAVAGGAPTSSNTTAQYGQIVTLSNTPSGSYTFSSYSVTKTNGGDEVAITNDSFTMPAEAVTVTATFEDSSKTDISGATVTLSESSFICDGSVKAPTVTAVKLGETDLTQGTDYIVNTIESKTNVGTYTVTVTGTGNYTGEATANWKIKRDLGVTLNGTLQWATYFAAENLEVPVGVTVYKVTGVSGTTVSVEAVDYIKANTGVLLYSETAVAEDNLKVGSGSGEYYTSTLLGSTSAGSMTTGTNYVLYNNQFILAENTELPANRCYIHLSGSATSRGLTIVPGNGNTTGIEDIPKDEGKQTKDQYYNMSGQRIDKPTKKGLYIVNGRKVVIK